MAIKLNKSGLSPSVKMKQVIYQLKDRTGWKHGNNKDTIPNMLITVNVILLNNGLVQWFDM